MDTFSEQAGSRGGEVGGEVGGWGGGGGGGVRTSCKNHVHSILGMRNGEPGVFSHVIMT